MNNVILTIKKILVYTEVHEFFYSEKIALGTRYMHFTGKSRYVSQIIRFKEKCEERTKRYVTEHFIRKICIS